MDRDQLNIELSFWQDQELALLEAALHAKQQIHRVQVAIGQMTVEQMKETGEINNVH